MRPITADLLVKAVGCSLPDARRFAEPITETCRVFSISTTPRLASFLAQTGHESLSFSRVVESLNYAAVGLLATWPSRFTPALAQQMQRQPEAIANFVYGGRLGNDSDGDGWRYRGRGLIHVTGKTNYEAIAEGLGERVADAVPDFVLHPEMLADPRWAALSAGCYWDSRNLNDLADKGEFDRISMKVNGGEHGKADRRVRLARAMKVLAS